MSQQLITALRDCVSVMERDLNGLAVIQPELNAAREALATLDTAPVWHGKGLPPVGTVCEYRWAGAWRQVEVIAHWKAPADWVAIYVPLEDGAHSTECGRAIADAFRPLRTPEQIAAEKRVQEIEVLEKDFFIIGFSSYRATAESLHRLGYRKIEGGAA